MPALRWEFYKDWWVVMGIDVPLTGLRPTTKVAIALAQSSIRDMIHDDLAGKTRLDMVQGAIMEHQAGLTTVIWLLVASAA